VTGVIRMTALNRGQVLELFARLRLI